MPRAWEIASTAGKRVCVLNVPQTFPIKPVNGVCVSCFLTPSTDSAFVYPPELKDEVQQVSDGYIIDVDNFRTEDKQWLLDEIYRMTDKQFAVGKHFLQKEKLGLLHAGAAWARTGSATASGSTATPTTPSTRPATASRPRCSTTTSTSTPSLAS